MAKIDSRIQTALIIVADRVADVQHLIAPKLQRSERQLEYRRVWLGDADLFRYQDGIEVARQSRGFEPATL